MFLQEFGDHPNVIKLHNVIKAENDKDIYLVFEFMGKMLYCCFKSCMLEEKLRRLSYILKTPLLLVLRVKCVHHLEERRLCLGQSLYLVMVEGTVGWMQQQRSRPKEDKRVKRREKCVLDTLFACVRARMTSLICLMSNQITERKREFSTGIGLMLLRNAILFNRNRPAQCHKAGKHSEGCTQTLCYVSTFQSYQILALRKCDPQRLEGKFL